MKKQLLIVGIILVLLVVGLSGCTDNSGNGVAKTVTMTAKELQDDINGNTDVQTFLIIGYNSVDDGDTLIIQDIISETRYNSEVGATELVFPYDFSYDSEGFTDVLYSSYVTFWFEGDITSNYVVGDEVKITVIIKRVSFSYSTFDYDLELFDEQWESEEYFVSHISSDTKGFKPMPQSTIELVKAASSGETKTLYVDDDGGKDYTTIQEAINAASIGDTVYVYSGTYYDNVELNKAITLTGEDRDSTIIDGNNIGNVINISANGAELSGFTIQNSGDNSFTDAGIYVSSNSVTTSNNLIINNEFGILTHGFSYGTINGNTISNNSWNGIDMSLWSENNEISENVIRDNENHGISFFGYSDNNIISDNDIINNEVKGIYLSASYGNNFYHNNFIGNAENANESGFFDSEDDEENIWDDSISEGNYWDDYTSIDSDGDGIGDVSYEISGGENEDRYPLMTQYQH